MAGEEVERERWADKHSPRGELVGGGHQLLEVERGRQEGGHQRQRVRIGTLGEGLANHHPVEEEEVGEGSLTEMRKVDWLKAVTEWLLQFVLIIQFNNNTVTERLGAWQQHNHPKLNISKTNELVVHCNASNMKATKLQILCSRHNLVV